MNPAKSRALKPFAVVHLRSKRWHLSRKFQSLSQTLLLSTTQSGREVTRRIAPYVTVNIAKGKLLQFQLYWDLATGYRAKRLPPPFAQERERCLLSRRSRVTNFHRSCGIWVQRIKQPCPRRLRLHYRN